jgi:hypothetical protein
MRIHSRGSNIRFVRSRFLARPQDYASVLQQSKHATRPEEVAIHVILRPSRASSSILPLKHKFRLSQCLAQPKYLSETHSKQNYLAQQRKQYPLQLLTLTIILNLDRHFPKFLRLYHLAVIEFAIVSQIPLCCATTGCHRAVDIIKQVSRYRPWLLKLEPIVIEPNQQSLGFALSHSPRRLLNSLQFDGLTSDCEFITVSNEMRRNRCVN